MLRARPDPEVYARRTHDTGDEYFRHRVLNLNSTEYLREIAQAEAEGEARKERIKLINQHIAEVEAESSEQAAPSAESNGEQWGEEAT